MTKAFWFLIAAVALQAFTIDLVVAPRSTDEQYLAVPAAERADRLSPLGVISDQTAAIIAPLFEVAVSFDRSSYNLGEEFFYEATLRYIGQPPISFPISAEIHHFRKSMPSLRVGTLAVSFAHPDTGHQIQIVDNLFGAETVPGSLITLTFNQVVRVRGKGIWQIRLQNPIAEGVWPANVNAAMQFNMDGLAPIFSQLRSPSVAITLSKPR